jgi:hypothetical protein
MTTAIEQELLFSFGTSEVQVTSPRVMSLDIKSVESSSPNTAFPADWLSGTALDFSYGFAPASEANPTTYLGHLSISLSKERNAEKLLAYEFSVTVAAIINIAPQFNEGERQLIASSRGMPQLYAFASTVLQTITGLSAHGVITLPTVKSTITNVSALIAALDRLEIDIARFNGENIEMPTPTLAELTIQHAGIMNALRTVQNSPEILPLIEKAQKLGAKVPLDTSP